MTTNLITRASDQLRQKYSDFYECLREEDRIQEEKSVFLEGILLLLQPLLMKESYPLVLEEPELSAIKELLKEVEDSTRRLIWKERDTDRAESQLSDSYRELSRVIRRVADAE